MTPEPILIPCEGSGCPAVQGICPMCGRPGNAVTLWISDGLMSDHERQGDDRPGGLRMKTELAIPSALFRCPRCGHEETQAAASDVWHRCAGRRETVRLRKVKP